MDINKENSNELNNKKSWDGILNEYIPSKRRLSKIKEDVFEFYKKSILYNSASHADSWYGYPKSKGSFGIYYGAILVSGAFTNIIEMVVDQDISSQIGLKTRPIKSSEKRNKPLLFWISTDIEDIGRINNIELIWKHYQRATAILNEYPEINKESPYKTKNKLKFTDILLPSGYNLTQERFFSNELEQEELDKLLNKDKQYLIEELRKLRNTDSEYTYVNSKRYKRDNKTIAQLKIVRDFKCQMCSTTILKSNGKYYIEGAHIKPKSKKGNELPDNILILCPNHHKEFDYGKKKIISHTREYLEFELNDIYYKISLKI